MSKTKVLFATLIVAASLTLLFLRPQPDDRPSIDPVGDTPSPVSSSPPSRDTIQAFLEWEQTWSRTQDSALVEEGLELARQRSALLAQMLRDDPEVALQAALSYAQYDRLPEELKAVVEEPFSIVGDTELIAICDRDPETPEYSFTLTREDGGRLTLLPQNNYRAARTKRGVPVQGIQLGTQSILRESVFQVLVGEDREWSLANLPHSRTDLSHDFLTGELIATEPLIAISGGHVFAFADRASLERLETGLASLDELAGQDHGSSALMAEVARKERRAFPLDDVVAEQQTLSLAAAEETRSYFIIRLDFSDKVGTPLEVEEFERMVNNAVAPALKEYSYGKTTVALTVSDSVTRLGASTSYTETDTLYDDALSAYIAAGNPDPTISHDFVAISFPDIEAFKWAGLATIEGQRQWLHGAVNVDTILHELGHNYGLKHASYWVFDRSNPDSIDPTDSTGDSEEYGDIFDVMGDGHVPAGHFHMAAKQQLGWIDNAQWVALNDASDSGIHRVYQFDDRLATATQALRIARSGTSEFYWLGLRQLYPGVPYLDRGAYFLWQRDGEDPFQNRTWLIDTTPGSSEGKVDAGIDLGRTYADPVSEVYITPLAIGQSSVGAYLDVAVNFGPFPGNQSPVGSLDGPDSAEARVPTTFTVTASDPDDDELAYHWNFGDGIVESSAPSIDHSFPIGGVYELKVTISDMKGGSLALVQTVTVSDPINTLHTRDAGFVDDPEDPYDVPDLLSLGTNGNVLVAGGSGGTFLRSEDGTTWDNHSLGFGNQNVGITCIRWSGAEFLAVGRNYNHALSAWVGVAFTSPDGVNWTKDFQTTGPVGASGFGTVAVSPDTNVAVVTGSNGKLYRRSPSGEWSEVDLGLPEDGLRNDANVAFGNGYFVVVGTEIDDNGFVVGPIIRRSADGMQWESLEAESGVSSGTGMRTVWFFNNAFLGSGVGSRLAYSEDLGTTWKTNYPHATHSASVFAYGNGIYSAHGLDRGPEGGLLDMLSTDGRNWKVVSAAPTVSYNDRIFFNNTFISVANTALIHQTDPFQSLASDGFGAWIAGFITVAEKQDALANPDKDWAPNFLEYALGSDPSDSASIPRPPELFRDAEGKIGITINRFAKTDVVLTLEISSDLASWTTLPATATTDTQSLLQLATDRDYDTTRPFFIRIKAAD